MSGALIGTTVGPYEITAKLGEGGMGEVYRATDTQLRREVAIKVLPAAFTDDRERLARFEREAQLLAQLHHPNIASIFGVEETDGVRALVMELVEGPTLAERLEQGALPLEETLSIARQIAEALEEAHEKGIVHRDLKPQNIKASPGGRVKVLDFGLAKAMDPAAGFSASISPVAASPTLTLGATLQGMILGTAAYMSPEQAAGGAADRRADIWAFGVVLFEMLAGKRLFEGETVPHVLAGVLKDEPDFSALPAAVPPRIRRLVRRCLKKKPRERLQAIGDARVVIDEVLAGAADEVAASAAMAVERPSRPVWRVALALAAAAALGALATFLALDLARRAAVPLERGPRTLSELSLPEGQARMLGAPVLSPDGARLAVVYEGSSDGMRRIWIRNLATGDLRLVPGTETARLPFWSPDGRSLGFMSGRDAQIKRVDLDGGRPVSLARVSSPCGASWGKQLIVYCESPDRPLHRVSPSGGVAEPIYTAAKGEQLILPWFLPDGERFTYLNASADESRETRLFLGSVDGAEPRALLDTEARGQVDQGHLYFQRGKTVLARPFDLATGKLGEEDPRIVVEEVASAFWATFTVAGGVLVYAPASAELGSRIAIYDRSGKRQDQIDADSFLDDIVLSPDGRVAAVMKTSGGDDRAVDVWTIDLARKVFNRATYGERDDDPVFSPDGRSLAFAHGGDLYLKPTNGPGEPKLLVDSETDIVTQDWTEDDWIVYSDPVDGAEDLFAVRPSGGEPKRLTSTPYREGLAQVAPNGKWLAYVSDESGDAQVYLTTWPDCAGKWRVSAENASMPRWGRGGRELYYLNAKSIVMKVEIGGGEAPEIGLAEELFAADLSGSFTARTSRWAAADDGERFYVIEAIPEQKSAEGPALMLVTNPLAGLETRR